MAAVIKLTVSGPAPQKSVVISTANMYVEEVTLGHSKITISSTLPAVVVDETLDQIKALADA